MARSSTQPGTIKSLIYSILCILFGVGLIFLGVSSWQDPADCGGQTMQQGDTCEVTTNGTVTDHDMSQQESSNHTEAIIAFILGPLMIVGGGFWLSSEIRIRQRRNAAGRGGVAVAGAGPYPGQFPNQYNPAQGMGQPQYPAPAQQQYGAPVHQPQYGFPQQQQQQQQQYYPPQAQQPQPQPYGAPPQQQGWPVQQGQQQYPQPPQQQGGWPTGS